MAGRRFLVIDGSYFVFHRFFALANWYKLHNPLKEFKPEGVFEDREFMDKYDKLFGENVQKLMKRHQVADEGDVLFVEDCPRHAIWRNSLFDAYKKSRKPSTINPQMFKHSLHALAPMLGLRVVSYPCAEADDIAYVIGTDIAHSGNSVTVITNDNDYLQMCDGETIEVYNIQGIDLSSRLKGLSPSDYLKYKILVGDKSDNIPGAIPAVGPKRAMDLLRDEAKLQRILESNPDHMARFNTNNTLMNFKMIPADLSAGIMAAYKKMT